MFVLAEEPYKSAIGDPGMRRDGLRVAIEAWNQCNEVGEEAPNMGNPRMAIALILFTHHPSKPFSPQPRFPCFRQGCMNMPLIYHNYTTPQGEEGNNSLRGSFYGTWDLDADVTKAATENDSSYYSITWERRLEREVGFFIMS
ncbi:hypothetical protein ACSBR1_008383 [Camellia fascicularis]